MSNAGRQYPSEMREYKDAKTGCSVVQLTQTGCSRHLYFTENSFTAGKEEIIYLHSESDCGEKGRLDNVFAMDLHTGIRTQLTDFAGTFSNTVSFTKSRDSRYVLFIGDGDLCVFERETGETRVLLRSPLGMKLGSVSISADCRYAAVAANDIPALSEYTHENYGGFKENFYGHKVGQIWLVRMDGSYAEMIREDTHWLGHVQFAPDSNEVLTYCHEGPWNYVQQRIWILNLITRRVRPCFVQAEDDSIGHEFWTRDGLIFFDNRGRGHDGTITSDKTQAVTVSADGADAIPWIGFADRDGRLLRRMDLPYYCNHYHANNDNSLLVADAVDDIVLIDIHGDKPVLHTLCTHQTSWRYQAVHCHPTWSWDCSAILFASDRDCEGRGQLYLVRRPAEQMRE